MTVRFLLFIVILAAAAASVGWGLFGYAEQVYQKPDPRDDQTVLSDEFSEQVGEIALTSLVSRMSLERHEESGELIDLANNAPCQS
ncbi:MAG: hypothetical protein ABFS86_18015 [Planctomycetota bacterium]